MISKLIKERRSIRVFSGKKISLNDMNKIIEAGIWAPTGCNNQELRFVILEKENVLTEVLKFKPFFRGVSHFILVLCDMSIPLSAQIYKKKSPAQMMSDLDTGLAIQNMVLLAKDIGIDSCIVNLSEQHYKKEKNLSILQKIFKEFKKKFNLHSINPNSFEYFLRNFLQIPKQYKIRAGVVFGYGKNFPNIEKAKHGKNMIKRNPMENYIIKVNYAE
ncbi:MAG: nitroreductase family protein [Candidatus Tenebribacter mawsonii]|nr:nitroreductase family protein [Candidatus Tenebribacter mawsonii]